MPSNIRKKDSVPSIMDLIITQKLKVNLGNSSIDRNILNATSKQLLSKNDIFNQPKSGPLTER